MDDAVAAVIDYGMVWLTDTGNRIWLCDLVPEARSRVFYKI